MSAEKVIYIKAEQAVNVTHRQVLLGEVLSMTGTEKRTVQELRKQVLYVVPDEAKAKYVISILKVIEFIQKQHPDTLIINMGETEIILGYRPSQKENKWLQYVKLIFVCFATAIGSAFTIMTFDQDVNVAGTFEKISMLVGGNTGTSAIALGYCVGLPVGIIVFFNHFSKRTAASDPTPLQVQLRSYESDVNQAIIKNADRENKTIEVD